MKLWRKNKKTDSELPSFVKTGLIRFNQKLIGIANFLQQKTNDYSAKKKKLLLVIFITVFLTESSLVIIQSVKKRDVIPIVLTRIKPLSIEKQESQPLKITKSEFLRIQRFKNYMDSLATTAKGWKLRDSLLTSRPQLIDSVNFLINLYLVQLKTKQ